MAYTEVTISSYNATPPTDDGSAGTANEITWAGIKTKLGNPIKTAIEAIDDNISSACGSIDTAVTSANTSISTMNTALTTALTALYAPSGTKMVFADDAAPTLWTKDTTHDNKALRLVTGTPSSGGSTAFTSVLTSRSITTAEMQAHTHTIAASGSLSFPRSSWTYSLNTDDNSGFKTGGQNRIDDVNHNTSSIGTVTISFDGTTSTDGTASTMDFAIQYVDAIICTKD